MLEKMSVRRVYTSNPSEEPALGCSASDLSLLAQSQHSLKDCSQCWGREERDMSELCDLAAGV